MRDLEAHGLRPGRDVYWHLPVPLLYEHTLRRGEGTVAHKGPLVFITSPYTPFRAQRLLTFVPLPPRAGTDIVALAARCRLPWPL